jgi:hypothetical protein
MLTLLLVDQLLIPLVLPQVILQDLLQALRFQVTDASGCYYSESYHCPVTPIVATATKLTDVDCFGNTTGSIRYGVSGFATTYSYTVNGGSPVTGQTASTFTLPNLGQYVTVIFGYSTGCAATTSIIINQPAAALSAAIPSTQNCNVPTSSVTVTVAEEL